jgi:transcriptional regulator with XRE-family HTH domain
MKTNLSARIRSARLAQGLGLRDVEAKGGISNGYLCQVEHGQVTDVHPKKLRVLAKALKLDYLELMILAGHLTIRDLKGKLP